MNETTILRRAKDIANSQGRLANSPGELTGDGTITLCAASCMAQAALEMFPNYMSAEEFRRQVLVKKKSELIPRIFEAVGLDSNRAVDAMVANDSCDPNTRLAWFNSLETI